MKNQSIFYGFNPPFIGGPQNILSRQEDDRLIKNDILQLLLTVPGERVMRPDFGVHLRSFVFEPSTQTDISVLQREIQNGIALHEPRVVVESVDVEQDEARNGLNIKIVVRLKKDLKRLLTIEHFLSGRA